MQAWAGAEMGLGTWPKRWCASRELGTAQFRESDIRPHSCLGSLRDGMPWNHCTGTETRARDTAGLHTPSSGLIPQSRKAKGLTTQGLGRTPVWLCCSGSGESLAVLHTSAHPVTPESGLGRVGEPPLPCGLDDLPLSSRAPFRGGQGPSARPSGYPCRPNWRQTTRKRCSPHLHFTSCRQSAGLNPGHSLTP